MSKLVRTLKALRRPQTLMRAARYGLQSYNRARDLRRLMHRPVPPAPQIALRELIEIETRLECKRKEGFGAYSVTRHIEVLAAIMGELRLLPEFRAD